MPCRGMNILSLGPEVVYPFLDRTLYVIRATVSIILCGLQTFSEDGSHSRRVFSFRLLNGTQRYPDTRRYGMREI